MKHVTLFMVVVLLCGSLLAQEEKNAAVEINLEELTHSILSQNLGVKVADTEKKIPEAAVLVQESIFDTLFSASTDYFYDKKEPANSVFGRKSTTYNYALGLDKKLPIGLGLALDFKNTLTTSDSSFSQRRLWDTSFGLSITQELVRNYFGFMDRKQLQAKEEQARAAQNKSYRDIETIVASGHEAYWNLSFAQENLKIREGNLQLAHQLHKINKERLELGLIEKSDFHASAAHVERAKAELELANMTLEEARIALRNLLNQAEEQIPYAAQDGLLFAKKSFSKDEAFRIAFEMRQDLQSLKKTVEAQKLIVRVASNNRLPQIDVKGSITTNGLDRNYGQSLEELGHGISPQYGIGFFITYPFENSSARGTYQAEKAQKKKLLLQLGQLDQNIQSEVKNAMNQLTSLAQATEKRIAAEKLLNDKLKAEVTQLKQGRSSIDVVIQDHERLLAARTDTALSIRDHNIAWMKLQLAQGTLLNGYENQLTEINL